MVGEKKPGRGKMILENLREGADIGTCKVSAQLYKWFPKKGLPFLRGRCHLSQGVAVYIS